MTPQQMKREGSRSNVLKRENSVPRMIKHRSTRKLMKAGSENLDDIKPLENIRADLKQGSMKPIPLGTLG